MFQSMLKPLEEKHWEVRGLDLLAGDGMLKDAVLSVCSFLVGVEGAR